MTATTTTTATATLWRHNPHLEPPAVVEDPVSDGSLGALQPPGGRGQVAGQGQVQHYLQVQVSQLQVGNKVPCRAVDPTFSCRSSGEQAVSQAARSARLALIASIFLCTCTRLLSCTAQHWASPALH
jgi:hypothetical protein